MVGEAAGGGVIRPELALYLVGIFSGAQRRVVGAVGWIDSRNFIIYTILVGNASAAALSGIDVLYLSGPVLSGLYPEEIIAGCVCAPAAFQRCLGKGYAGRYAGFFLCFLRRRGVGFYELLRRHFWGVVSSE